MATDIIAQGLAKVASTGIVSLARFNIPADGAERSVAINNALISAKSGGDNMIFIPPSDAGFGVDVATSIRVPDGMTIHGVPGRSLIKGLGTDFQSDCALLYVCDPATGNRYGAETGFRTIGSGATFAFTVSSGAVTAVSIVSGGTGYQQGDKLLFANGTILWAMVTAGPSGGPVTGIVIESGGSGWGTPSNPYTHTNTNGVLRQDRIVDPTSFASQVIIRDIVLDGNWG